MKVSLNWVKKYIDFELPPVGELSGHIGTQLGAIEDTEDLGAKYNGVVAAKVISCVEHPNSDHLHICMIDDGGAVKDVERNEQGHIQVVCGAPNVREGLTVAWLPPGVVVPETTNKEPFTLSVREIRGVKSNGMLASARELALGTNHEGILEIDTDAKPGEAFADIYELNDYIIDIENKMFTHRPDLFGELGIAREIAGILHHAFTSPEWYRRAPSGSLPHGGSLPLTVQNELPDLVPRFMAVALSDIQIKPSPVWLQTYLSRVGIRPISNVVDITNYMMILTGQPLHAYDYDKVRVLSGGEGAVLCVRYPRSGEKLTLLSGKEVEPRTETIMIATDKQAIGIGGVMGGADTEVDDHTKNIILECATFDMYSIRKTSMALGLFTDAVTRFNKGQSPLQNDRIVGESLRLFGELAGAKQAGEIIDDTHVPGREWVHPPVPVTTAFINERLGLKLSAGEMKQLLENVEFTVTADGDTLTVAAPFWRTDIEMREDIVEEVGRLYGYDKLPLELPRRDIAPAQKNALIELKSHIRHALSAAGANEVLTYSFVHGNLLDKVGQERSHAFQLSNALSPDLQYYRLSLMPSLLEKIRPNIKAGYDEFVLFELGKVHIVGENDAAALPREDELLGLVVTANDKLHKGGAPYYEAKAYLESLVGTRLMYKPVPEDMRAFDITKPYDMERSAFVYSGDTFLGLIGEFRQEVLHNLKLPQFTAGFELDVAALLGHMGKVAYEPLPRFPAVSQDICFKVAADVPYQRLFDTAQSALDGHKPDQTRASLSPVDIYQREDDTAHKQITLHLDIASYEKTMTDTEVTKLLDAVAASVHDALDAERV